MSILHLVQGGIENGDLEWLKRSAVTRAKSTQWVVPKTAQPGDEVIIYIAGHGLFATAAIASRPKVRSDWKNRYGAALSSIALIRPPISLERIREAIPDFKWARYPRSITTPNEEEANRIRSLVREAVARGAGEGASGPAVDAEIESDIARASVQLDSADSTTRRALVDARRGQGPFRERLIEYWKTCAVTGCALPPALRASHIKPWRDSSNAERLDPFNGLLLVGTVDLLFDAGLITFLDSGTLVVSDGVAPAQRRLVGLRDGMRLRKIDGKHRMYLRWHREYAFGSSR